MSVFGWLNDQLLRMTWLNDLVGSGVAAVGLDPASRLGGSVQFSVVEVSVGIVIVHLAFVGVPAGGRRHLIHLTDDFCTGSAAPSITIISLALLAGACSGRLQTT